MCLYLSKLLLSKALPRVVPKASLFELHLLCVRTYPSNSWKFRALVFVWSCVIRLGPKAAALQWSHPVPGTVAIPEGGLGRPYQGAALLSSSVKGSTFLRGDYWG